MPKVRILAAFVDAREHFRSYVPGDTAELPQEKAEALARSGHVEIIKEQEHPAKRRQTKVKAAPETKATFKAEQFDEDGNSLGYTDPLPGAPLAG